MGWRSFKEVSIPDTHIIQKDQGWDPETDKLIQWFTDNVHRLPTKPFKLCEGEGWSIHYMTPAATYQNLTLEIVKKPDGPWAAEIISILEQLHNLFGGKF